MSFAVCSALTAVLACSQLLQAQTEAAPAHTFFRVKAAETLTAPVSGRLLLFVKPGSGDKEVSINEFAPTETWVAAQEIHGLEPGDEVEVNADQVSFPEPFSELSAGLYEVQAVLDVDHTYNYSGRGTEDWISNVITLAGWKPGSAAEPELVLDHHPEADGSKAALENLKATVKADVAQLVEFESPALTRFWGWSTKIRAWVILPPGYANAKGTYPTVYWTHGFGGNIDGALVSGARIYERMKAQKMPPMIWVMLDESCPQGTHEFADSVNDGPWGTALTAEFIPAMEKKYRMDARRDGRFVQGHSSGGWASLQLEVNYPKVFGGTWSTSPDPSNFHDFTGIDLYADHANVYHRPDGSRYPIMRDKGKVLATAEQFTRLEQVLGPYGGQMTSFDWVFSPKSASGAPEALFDRATGDVDPKVMAYWQEHWDLAHVVTAHWAERGADLKGRIHVYVGTADTFYLDGAAHKFDAVLKGLGADAHFTYIPDRTHFDLYGVGDDRQALFDEIGQQMWDVARPGKNWKNSE
jgi:S-formylglutathione hydrolase FrmB